MYHFIANFARSCFLQVQICVFSGQRPSGMGGITSMNNDQPAKEWHKNVALDLRNHLVHKL